MLDGVELYKYRPYAPGGPKAAFVLEYLYSFVATLWLAIKAARKGRFAAVQSCNPPDIFWPIGVLFRVIHRSRFVFDHHDLCPETYESASREADLGPQGRCASWSAAPCVPPTT